MYYVYVLRSEKTGHCYIGQAKDLKNRFYSHNSGKNIATKAGQPWELVYYEAFSTRQLAVDRERKLKNHGKGFAELKRRIGLVDR